MLSMTGFGQANVQDDALGSVDVQVATVNHKGCRVSVRSDLRDLGLEERLRQQAQQALKRGSVTLQISIESASELSVDRDGLARAWNELAQLAEQIGAPTPRLEDVARLQGHGGGRSIADWSPLIERALSEALSACADMREREGAALAAAFADHHARLFEIKTELAAAAAGRVVSYRDRLAERLSELDHNLDEAVLARELAVYADRIDITEELVRLDSHLDQLASLLRADGSIGKRVEFLLQEVGRELNTSGAKANDAGLQALVVEGKHVLDQMREQIANVV